jgi:hypothetical protein
MKSTSLLPIIALVFLAFACRTKGSESSAASVGADSGTLKELCGTVFARSDSIFLQSVEGNSEDGGDYMLEPQDGATTQVLEDLAYRSGRACITAHFSGASDPVSVKTVASIRETN